MSLRKKLNRRKALASGRTNEMERTRLTRRPSRKIDSLSEFYLEQIPQTTIGLLEVLENPQNFEEMELCLSSLAYSTQELDEELYEIIWSHPGFLKIVETISDPENTMSGFIEMAFSLFSNLSYLVKFPHAEIIIEVVSARLLSITEPKIIENGLYTLSNCISILENPQKYLSPLLEVLIIVLNNIWDNDFEELCSTFGWALRAVPLADPAPEDIPIILKNLPSIVHSVIRALYLNIKSVDETVQKKNNFLAVINDLLRSGVPTIVSQITVYQELLDALTHSIVEINELQSKKAADLRFSMVRIIGNLANSKLRKEKPTNPLLSELGVHFVISTIQFHPEVSEIYSLWSLSNLATMGPRIVDLIFETKVIEYIQKLCHSERQSVVNEAVYTLCIIITVSSESQAEKVIFSDMPRLLGEFLVSYRESNPENYLLTILETLEIILSIEENSMEFLGISDNISDDYTFRSQISEYIDQIESFRTNRDLQLAKAASRVMRYYEQPLDFF